MSFDPIQEASTIVGEREFYIFDMGELPNEHYTTHHEAVTESDLTGAPVTWQPLPILRRGVKKKHTAQPETTKLILPVLNSFVSLVAQGGLDAIGITIIRGFGDDYANDYRSPWWVGFLQDITVSTDIIEGNLRSVESLFEDSFPRLFHQPGCNNTLFDPVCALNPALFLITRTITTIAGDGRLVDVDGAIPTSDFYSLGRMRLVGSGDIWRHVIRQDGLQFILHIPILGLAVGDSVDILPGCAKRVLEDCVTKFGNKPQNVSMANIPVANPVIDGF